VDLVYRTDGDTPLVSEARRLGRRVTEGRMVLLAQTQRQYYRMTGEKMPAGLGRRLLGLEPDGRGNSKRSRQHATSA
jgi:shikimate 5-dehydrogenase